MLIIQQIYEILALFNNYSQDEREELVKGYQQFLFETDELLQRLDYIVEGRTPWGWKIEWGSQPWQIRTYRQQVGLTLQAGWEDKFDSDLDLFRASPVTIPQELVSETRFQALTPVDLDALGSEPAKPDVITDICKVGSIQCERLFAFHEQVSNGSSTSSGIGDANELNESPLGEEDTDLDSMPELEDETNLDNIEIPVWLIPHGVILTFRGRRITFEREQGPPWREVLAKLIEEQD